MAFEFDGLRASLGSDPRAVRQRVEAMKKLLEGLVTVPG